MVEASTNNGNAVERAGGREHDEEDADVASNIEILGDIDGIMGEILAKNVCVFKCKSEWKKLKNKLGELKEAPNLTPDEASNPVVDNIKLKFLAMVERSSKVRLVLKGSNKLSSVSSKLKTLCPFKKRKGMTDHKMWKIVQCKKEEVEATSSGEDLMVEEEATQLLSSVAETFENEKGNLEQEMAKEHDTDFAEMKAEIAPWIRNQLAQFALDDKIHRNRHGHAPELSLAQRYQDSVGAKVVDCGVGIAIALIWGLLLVCAVSNGGR